MYYTLKVYTITLKLALTQNKEVYSVIYAYNIMKFDISRFFFILSYYLSTPFKQLPPTHSFRPLALAPILRGWGWGGGGCLTKLPTKRHIILLLHLHLVSVSKTNTGLRNRSSSLPSYSVLPLLPPSDCYPTKS